MYTHYPMMYGFDYTYVLVLIGVVVSMIASANVKLTFNKYKKIGNARNLRAEDVAKKMLNDAGIYDVTIQHIGGNLSDHYSPREKVLRLSDSVYGSTSVAAIGVAAHECGHAIQDQERYPALVLRSAAVPLANFGTKLSWPLIFLGLFLGFTPLAQIGIYLFILVVLFQIITLPVEFDASKRALRILETSQILSSTEVGGARKVLTAAALTYVAALLTSILQLLRFIILTQNRRSKR